MGERQTDYCAVYCKNPQTTLRKCPDRTARGSSHHREANSNKCNRMIVFGRVFKKTTIPVFFPDRRWYRFERMAPLVKGARRRFIANRETGRPQPGAKIHVLKPNRPESLIESAQLLPRSPAEHKECASGL